MRLAWRAGRSGPPRGGVREPAAHRGLVDAHVHLLWGLDDGPTSLEESVELAVLEHRYGVDLAIATPHVSDPGQPGLKQVIGERVDALRQALAEAGCGLAVEPGAEIEVGLSLLEAAKTGEVITLGRTPFVLVEFGLFSVPLCCDEALFELALHGFRPVLAHPERNASIQRNTMLALELAEHGVALQVDAGSLLGEYGIGAARTAASLLRSGKVALLASDAHSGPGQADRLERVAGVAARFVGAERAAELASGAALGLAPGGALKEPWQGS